MDASTPRMPSYRAGRQLLPAASIPTHSAASATYRAAAHNQKNGNCGARTRVPGFAWAHPKQLNAGALALSRSSLGASRRLVRLILRSMVSRRTFHDERATGRGFACRMLPRAGFTVRFRSLGASESHVRGVYAADKDQPLTEVKTWSSSNPNRPRRTESCRCYSPYLAPLPCLWRPSACTA